MSQPVAPQHHDPEKGVAHVGETASIGRVLRDQRKIVYLGLGFMVAAFWILGPLGRWGLGAMIAAGVALALVNHVATELWLLRLITSGRQATRNEMIASTMVRLLVLAVVAVAAAVVFWPQGIGLLLGLAIFRLIALMMTSLTLLKELEGTVSTFAPMEIHIEPGKHEVGHLGGFAFNLDTIWTTVIAGGIVVVLGLIARRALTRDPDDHVPTKVQLLWETLVTQVNTQVEDNLGRINPFVAPLAIALFFFILIANWLELLPTEINEKLHLTPAPTADVNLTYALALFVMVGVWTFGIREKGVRGYFRHFIEPFPLLLPLNILEELIKPLTLALRLFGNIFAGGIMLALIAALPVYVLWAPNLIWKLFDMFIGGIQAFIFALLTVLYFAMAGAGHGSEHDEHEPDAAKAPEPEPAVA